MVPHGLSVILTAPAVFRWTCAADPDKHLRAAQLLGIFYIYILIIYTGIKCVRKIPSFLISGANITNINPNDAGLLLADTVTELLSNWRGFVPDGLGADGLGYDSQNLEALVHGTLPQRKVIDVSPRQPTPEDFHLLLSESMKLF